jgi:glycosyltransferase involved in cell wall biosynthesis
VRVLFVAPLPDPVTGQSLACQVFLDELRKRHDVDVVNPNKSGFRQGVDSLARVAQIVQMLFRVCRKLGTADVIYYTNSESTAGNAKDLIVYALAACFGRLSCMVVHLHGGAGMRRIMLGESAIRRKLNEFFVSRMAAVIVLGQRHVDLYAAVVPAGRIHVVPNFAEDYLFSDPGAVRAKFSQMSLLRVLFLSNLLPGKGHVELLDAVLALDDATRKRLRVDFAGGFESTAQQREFQARIADCPEVCYHGVVRGEAKRRLLSAAHVLCLPTYYPYEGQPICILEAYASGCAVITTDHSGICDIFQDGRNGYQVAKGSASDLQRALLRAISEPQQLMQMALSNLTNAMANFRTDTYCKRLMQVLEGAAESL